MPRSTKLRPEHCAACDKPIDGTFLAFRCRLHCVCFPCVYTIPHTVADWTKTQCAYCMMEEFNAPFVKSTPKAIKQTCRIKLRDIIPGCAWATMYSNTIAVGRTGASVVDIVNDEDGPVQSHHLGIGEGITSGLYLDSEKCMLTVKGRYNVYVYNINPRCCSSSKPHMIRQISFNYTDKPINVFVMSNSRYGLLRRLDNFSKTLTENPYAFAIFSKKDLYTESSPKPSLKLYVQFPKGYQRRHSDFDRMYGTPDGRICLSCYWNHEVLIFTDTGLYIKSIGYANDPMAMKPAPGGLWCPVTVETIVDGAVLVTCKNGDVHSFTEEQGWKIVKERDKYSIGIAGSMLSDSKIWITRLDGIVDVFDTTNEITTPQQSSASTSPYAILPKWYHDNEYEYDNDLIYDDLEDLDDDIDDDSKSNDVNSMDDRKLDDVCIMNDNYTDDANSSMQL